MTTTLETTAPETTGYTTLLLDQLVPSLTNPRKFFNPLKLEELASSIRKSGVHQPILVRQLPASRLRETFADRRKGAPLPTHEIVTGERRYRASKMADQPIIPVLIKDLSDTQALELQIVENLQRDDLMPLEEAEGYSALMRHTHISADEIGAKIGKSRGYVYARLKLLELASDSATALREGRIDATTALLIARVPDSKLQAKALAYATTPTTHHDDSRPSGRAFKVWLQQNVMLRLEDAPFPIESETLVSNAGPCQLCPQRTGHDPDLFADVDSPDLCTNPKCYNDKTGAWHDIKIKQAGESGMEFVTGKQAKEIFGRAYQPNHMDGYTDLREIMVLDDGREVTIAEAIGKKIPGVMLVENPYTRHIVEAAPTDEVQAILLARGLMADRGHEAANARAVHIKSNELAMIKRSVVDRVAKAQREERWQAVRDALCAPGVAEQGADETAPHFSHGLLLAMCVRFYDFSDAENDSAAAEMGIPVGTGDDANEVAPDGFELADALAELDAPALVLLLKKLMVLEDRPHTYTWKECGPVIDALADDFDIDLSAIDAAVTAKIKKQVTAEIKVVQNELKTLEAANEKKHLPPPSSLAQPSNAEEEKKTKKPGTKSAPLRKPKMREEEALSGIAKAMQGDVDSADLRTAESHSAPVPDEVWPLPSSSTSTPNNEGDA